MGEWYDAVLDFGSKYGDKIVDAGSKLISAGNKGNTSSQLQDLLRRQEQNNYDTAKANNSAYEDWVKNVYGPASAANAAAQAKNRAAAQAAARKNEAARVAANKKAQGKMTETFNKANSLYQPYIKAGASAAPQAAKAYGESMAGLSEIQKLVMQPDMMALLGDIKKPAGAINIGNLPEYLTK